MNIDISSECEIRLKQISQMENIPPSEIIQKALQMYIRVCNRPSVSYYGDNKISEDRKNRALAAVGQFSSGLSDVSVRHDAYLADVFK